MDRGLLHVRTVHALVAEFRVRDVELVAGAASLFRPSGAHHVLRRLVNAHPPASPFRFLTGI